MWYLYDNTYVLISKSESRFYKENEVFYDEDINLDVFKVVVGSIEDVNGIPTIVHISKSMRSNYELIEKLNSQNETLNKQQLMLDDQKELLAAQQELISNQQELIEAQQAQVLDMNSTMDYLMTDVIPSMMELG